MTIGDIKKNIKNMSDKELANAYVVGKEMQEKNVLFDSLDKYCLNEIEWEILCRLSDGDYIDF